MVRSVFLHKCVSIKNKPAVCTEILFVLPPEKARALN